MSEQKDIPSILRIYMKSGNIIVLRGITDWKFKLHGEVRTFEWAQQANSGENLIATSLLLNEVEAITEEIENVPSTDA